MQKHVGMYFKKISEKLEKRANENRGKHDITFTQGKVLCFLHKNADTQITMRDIESYLDCSHATVSGILSRLKEKELVYFEQSETDRRAKIVKLTEKERSHFKQMQERRKKMEDTLTKGFSTQEKEKLFEFLERVYANLDW